MKKIITLLLIACLTLSLVGCGKIKDETTEYTLGMGTIVSLDNSDTASAQVDVIVAAVILDADGKIVNCTIDSSENKVRIADGVISPATFKTKMELGYDYGMKANDPDCDAEWFEQVHAFESYVVGMSGSEVAAIELRTRNTTEAHPGYVVAKDETLYASCSIQIIDIIQAVVKACYDEQAVKFMANKDFKVGVAIHSWIDEDNSIDAGSSEGVIAIYSEYASVAVDKNGKALAVINDGIQPKIYFGSEGEIVQSSYSATKRELKEDYNMVKNTSGKAIGEWYQQAAAFGEYCVGKTAKEIASIGTKERGDDSAYAKNIVASDSKLYAVCTIEITGLRDVTAQAASYALTPAN